MRVVEGGAMGFIPKSEVGNKNISNGHKEIRIMQNIVIMTILPN